LGNAGRYMRRIGVTGDVPFLRADANRRAIVLTCFKRARISLIEHSVINLALECALYRGQIRAPAVRGYLNAISEAIRQVFDERACCVRAAIAEHPRGDQFGVWIDCGPGPNAASLAQLAIRYIFLLRVDEAPDLIELEALAREVAQRLVLVLGACLTGVAEQF